MENVRKHMCCVETYGKRKKHIDLAREHMRNTRKIRVLRGNILKTKRKHMCCVGTYGKHNENIGVACKLMKRKENLGFALYPMDNTRKTFVLRGHQ